MSNDFDPYRKWLGIPPEEQPANHYRLLGIPLFETDVDVISNAADRQMAHVRTFQSGKYSKESQQILNELSAARVVLLDAKKREAYEAQLREKMPPAAPTQPGVVVPPGVPLQAGVPIMPTAPVYPAGYIVPQPPMGQPAGMPPQFPTSGMAQAPSAPKTPEKTGLPGVATSNPSPRTTHRRAKKGPDYTMIYVIGGIIVALLVILCLAFSGGDTEEVGEKPDSDPVSNSPAPAPESTSGAPTTSSSNDNSTENNSETSFSSGFGINEEIEKDPVTAVEPEDVAESEDEASSEDSSSSRKHRKNKHRKASQSSEGSEEDESSDSESDFRSNEETEREAIRREMEEQGLGLPDNSVAHDTENGDDDGDDDGDGENTVAIPEGSAQPKAEEDSEESDGPKDSGISDSAIMALGKSAQIRIGSSQETMRKYYGAKETMTENLTDGLEWLARHQLVDGGWCFNHSYVKPGKLRPNSARCENTGTAEMNRRSATALALMAFLGNGFSPKEKMYRKEIVDGIKFLGLAAIPVSEQNINTPQARVQALSIEASLAEGEQNYFRSHAWGTLVICEYLASAKDPAVARLANGLVAHLRNQQNGDGGWPNRERTLTAHGTLGDRSSAHDSSTSATLWNIMALHAAKNAGIQVPQSVFDKSENYLRSRMRSLSERCQKKYQNLNRTDTREMQEAIFALSLLGALPDREVAQQVGDRVLALRNISDVRRNFFGTMLLRDLRHEPWETWNQEICFEYLKSQVPKGEEKGSWFFMGEDAENSEGGRLYCTAFTLLNLESYFRYPPFRPLDEPEFVPLSEEEKHDKSDASNDSKPKERDWEADKEEEEEEEAEPLFPDFQ